ncbi:MAG: aldehyde dehydrogenase family protein [Promethearchaeota archaeon]|nr:MAG: aldehyde dehydrogenase family protein [Candidatus Lokiarchaeota archaeon]
MKLDILNKYTGELIDSLEADTVETINEKIKRTAQWEYKLLNTTMEERIEVIKDIASVLVKNKKKIKDIIVEEGGLPVKYSEWEFSIIEKGYSYVDWFIDLVQDREQRDLESGLKSLLKYQPMGLTIGITPRNTPMSLPMYYWGASFMTGNPAIIKPSTACPLTMKFCIDRIKESDFPFNGAYDLVISPGDFATKLFIESYLVKNIVCVAASHTAKQILIDYADFLKKNTQRYLGVNMITQPFKNFVFECAGNDAGIVMPGVNLELVAKWNVIASYTNSGQQCFSMKRIIVHQDIYDEYVELLLKEIEKLKMGDPRDPTTDIGPLGSRRILMMMEVMVSEAQKHKGVKVLCGAEKIDTGKSYGLFYKPTLVEIPRENILDFDKAPFLWREEAFGPVRSITKTKNLDDAIYLANHSNYGMRAVVYTTPENIERFSTELQAGSLYINSEPMQANISTALGGWKDSSYPPGIKYPPKEMVKSKIIYNGSKENAKNLFSKTNHTKVKTSL